MLSCHVQNFNSYIQPFFKQKLHLNFMKFPFWTIRHIKWSLGSLLEMTKMGLITGGFRRELYSPPVILANHDEVWWGDWWVGSCFSLLVKVRTEVRIFNPLKPNDLTSVGVMSGCRIDWFAGFNSMFNSGGSYTRGGGGGGGGGGYSSSSRAGRLGRTLWPKNSTSVAETEKGGQNSTMTPQR